MKTILLSLILLGVTEAIAKPIVTRLTQAGIRKYIYPAYLRLDRLLMLPENWDKFSRDAEAFIWDAVIPDEVDDESAKKLAKYLIKNFDMNTFLVKAKGEIF